MPTDEQRLVVALEARINSLEKGLAKAQRSTNQAMGRIEKRSTRAARRMSDEFRGATAGVETALNRIRGLAGGAFLGFSAGQFVGQVRRATEAVAELGRQASTAGINVEALQEFQAVARQYRVSQDALVDGFKELQLRADEFVETGAGPAEEAFKRLGFDARELATALRDPERLFIEIINRTRQVQSEAARLRIFDEIFGGTGGEQLIALLDATPGKIAAIREEARATGQVMSEEMVERAQEVDDKINDLARTLETRLHTALIVAGDGFFDFRDAALDAIGDIEEELNALGNSEFFRRVNQWLDARGLLSTPEGVEVLDESLSTSGRGMTAEEADRALAERRQELEGELRRAMDRRQMGIIWGDDEQKRQAEQEIRRLQGLLEGMAESSGEEVARLRDRFRQVGEEINTLSLKVASGNASGLGAMKARLEELNAELARIIDNYRRLTGGMELPWNADDYRGVAVAPPGIGGTGGPATGIDGSMDVLRRRLAHGNVRLEGLDQAAADAAAAVLSDPRFANIVVTSAVRSEAHNRRVGGAANSRHLPRMGADAIDFAGIRDDDQRRALAEALRAAGFTGFGTYEGQHIHADMGPERFWAKGQAPGWWGDFAGGEAAEREAEAQRRANAAMREAAALRERNATALERYIQGLQKASELLQRGLISQRDYNREVARLQEAYRAATEGAEQVPETVEEVASASSSAAQTIGSSLVDTLLAIAEDSDNAERALKRLAMQMARMALMGAIGQGPLAGLFGGGLAGAASASADGNIVGPGGPVPLRKYARGGVARSPHVALFGEGSKPEAFVPLPDGRTIPVTLRGPREPGPMGGRGGGNMSVTVIDQRQAGSPPVQQERRRRSDGGEELRLTIRDATVEAVRDDLDRGGELARVLESTYGLQRRLP